ncbi:dipeptidyl aminopeptidase/acylaminoacyl peptidase [Alkalibacillus filiformis]|uniref:Dipeptidyl aminopeptidase/acylaminoacyl peptidase n=1 Tax=Alkalibacillus filiformis TaxID=200990 RepID=A0ABU0DQZ9_9BACI|nr:S9 family peptidase [Alkalibacillus filiformis]MDQ0350795.1 dipeptidyl aminopeptidase/acylaminoacyl peptidase [Alkalibacillus filiformis]
MATKRNIKAEDLFNISSVSDPRYSPDYSEALFIKTELNEKENKYVSNLFHLDVEMNEVNQWTFGEGKVSNPRWSPDGNSIIFLSNREDKNQLYKIARFGGEAQKLTDEEAGVNRAEFSPDGKRIMLQTPIKKDDLNKQDDDEEKKDDDLPTPTVINRMKYKADGAGVVEEKYQVIKLFNIEHEEVETIKQGEQNFIFQTWVNDSQIIYSTDDSNDQDFNFNHESYIYNLKSKTDLKLFTEEGYASGFTVSPNGEHLLFAHMGRTYENATHAELYAYHISSGVTACLTEGFDAPVGDFIVADTQQQPVLKPVIWTSNEEFYLPVSNQGNVLLYYGHVDGSLYPAINERLHVFGFDINPTEQKALLTISKPTNPSELYELELTNGNLKQLTQFNESFMEEVELVEPEPISYKSKDDWKVYGWFMKPAGFEDSQKYPMVVNIHGGPHAFYGNSFFHEMQYLAASGYAVLYVNPRGSHSYGQEFVDAVRGDYGNGDYLDIMNGVDYVLNEYDWIDENRLGVTGGSYGGFMTNWIVGHTNRFKAAVTQRSISNWISFRGVSDIGYYFNDWQIKADFSDLDKMWKHSPIAYVDQIETPLKIIHNELDFRCPIEQAEQLYIALKYQKKETEFVRFPESDHNLSRTGKPNLRIERLNHIVGWFDRYLK